MAKKFQKLSLLVKIILLLIPVVNWITEIVVRVSALLEKPDLMNIVGFIIAIPFGIIVGWVDIVCVILTGHLFLAKV